MSKQDRQGVRTAQDLEQKYNLSAIKRTDKSQREVLSRVEQNKSTTEAKLQDLEEKVSKYETNFKNLEKQTEGKVDSSGWQANKILGTDDEGKIVEKEATSTGGDVLGAYPVGAIYMSVNSTSPSTLFGGTWERFANGKVLVGVDENDTDFATVKKTGGAKKSSHNHATNFSFDGNGFFAMSTNSNHDTTIEENVERGYFQPTNKETGRTRRDSTWNTEISLLQPYITCYMWVRTA